MTTNTQSSGEKWSISLFTLTLILVSFLAGGAAFGVALNSATGAAETFSTSELIGFILSVVLSAASIVLAITAIWMGKVSEMAMTSRSDESIRLLNDVYVRTTGALQRIEASTGVTEKRIEDIIQGRVGDLSQKIAKLASKPSGLMEEPQALENAIKQSLLEEVGQRAKLITGERLVRQQKRQSRYLEIHAVMLASFASLPGSKVKKLGHGEYGGSGDELFDVVADVNKTRVYAAALRSETILSGSTTEYFETVSSLLTNEQTARLVLIVDAKEGQRAEVEASAYSQFKRHDLRNRLSIYCGGAENVRTFINSLQFP